MSETVVNCLIKRREEITTEIKHMQLQLKAKAADIEHINATIRLFSPDYSIPKIKTPRGAISRKLFDVLRDSPNSMTTREIATSIYGEGSNEVPAAMTRIGIMLNNYQKKGVITSAQGLGNAKLWSIV